ncbi:MAG TPA: fatty acid desaturase [Chthoniobacter sp.]|nr:fatty acid desaturase [Chthoniobacter sp.]
MPDESATSPAHMPLESGHGGSVALAASKEREAISPAASQPATITDLKMGTFIGFILCHVLAALAFIPWLFSWSGVAAFVAGLYFFGILGINIGYHRLLTHRSFRCPRWLERTLAILGTCGMQFSPAFWVAVHRCHHQHSDAEHDPHSPVRGFIWAHFGWLITRRPRHQTRAILIDRYAPDLIRDPFYGALERGSTWIVLPVLSWLALFLVGLAGALAAGHGLARAVQLGASLSVWGGPLRTVFVWHTTWAVNSVTHFWGYRNYATPDDSRNNAIVALLAGGEGWHNNHHADPRSARHGHRWWEVDPSWWTIRLLMACGLATNVVHPTAAQRP